MVDVRTVAESDLGAFRRLHDRYVDREESIGTVRGWHRDHPDLLVGAYSDGELVGHALGLPRSAEAVELAGIAVVPGRREEGIGTKLLAAFEGRAAARGFRRVSLGSAGGYVDAFYVDRGYAPASVLVQFPSGDVPNGYRDLGYEIVDERVEDGTRRLYVGVEGFDPSFLHAVRADFGDEEAVYIMEKHLGGES